MPEFRLEYTMHSTPLHGELATPCCDATASELPEGDRMTLDDTAVTCLAN